MKKHDKTNAMSDVKVENLETPSGSSIISLIISGARTFGIGTIVAGFLLYEHFYVILPSHEENMRKQIEQCTQAVSAISENLKKINISIEKILYSLTEQQKKDIFHVSDTAH